MMESTLRRELKKEASLLYTGDATPDVDFTAMDDPESKPSCPVCAKTFKNVKILKKHFLLHTEKKSFVCDVCNKAFMRKYDCHQHMIKLHDYVSVSKGEVIRRDLAEAKNLFTAKLSDLTKNSSQLDEKSGEISVGEKGSVEEKENNTEDANQKVAKLEENVEREIKEFEKSIKECTANGEDAETTNAIIILQGEGMEGNGDEGTEMDMTEIALEEIKGEDVDLSINWARAVEQEEGKEGEEHVLLDGDKPTCPECGKKLKNAYMLQKHLENHNATREVECLVEGCDKKFKRKYDMEFHMVNVHNYIKLGAGNVVSRDQLPIDYKEQLKKLQRKKKRRGKKAEEIEFSDDEDDPVARLTGNECPICNQKFKNNVVLRRHYVIHINNKDFICEVCSKTFLRKYDMQAHQVNVHGYQRVKKGVVVKPETKGDEVDELLIPLGMNTHSQGKKRKIFKCQFCDSVAFSLINFDIHLEKYHSAENPFSCKDCDATFPSKRRMKMHWYFTHKEKKHKCRYCDKTFTFKFSLRDHENTHAPEGEFLCGTCGKGFAQIKYLKKHEQRHHGNLGELFNDSKLYTCRYCSETMEGLGKFQQHMRTHNSDEERKHVCEICQKRFFTLGHLKRHEFVHKETRDHVCEMCGKSYKDPDTLKKHEIAVHNKRMESRQVYICPEAECEGRGFLSMGHLKRHLLIHKGIKPFSCEECGRCFTEKATLLSHIRTHTGEKPYSCKECDRSFSQQSHLRRHMFLHTQVRNHVCQDCGRGFFSPEDLKRHMMFHSEIKPHKCLYCSKTFHHLSSLKTHMRVHSVSGDNKPYECDICKQKFTQKNSMVIHRRRHTGERPFKCSECGKCFISKQLCKVHLRSHFPGQYPRHQCRKCSKDYSGRQKLRQHMAKEHPEEDLEMLPNYQEPIVLIIKSVQDEDGKTHEVVMQDEDSDNDSNYSEEEELQEAESELTCDVCFLRFPDKETVEKHKAMHEDQKEFQCQVCLEMFDTVAKLHHHLVKNHGFVKLANGEVVRKQMESKYQIRSVDEGNVKTVYVEVESPTKYLNKPVKLAPKPAPIAPNQNTIIRIQPSTSAGAHSLLNTDTGALRIAPTETSRITPTEENTIRIMPMEANTIRVGPATSSHRKSFNIVEKDGTILHIVSPYDIKQNQNVEDSNQNHSFITLPQTVMSEEGMDALNQVVYDENALETAAAISSVPSDEIQTIIVSAEQEEDLNNVYVPESNPEEDSTVKSIINYQLEDAMQYVQVFSEFYCAV